MDLGIQGPISIYLDLFEKVNAHFSLMFCSSDSSFLVVFTFLSVQKDVFYWKYSGVLKTLSIYEKPLQRTNGIVRV